MNDRRNRTRVKNRTVAYVFAGLVHAAIIVALLVNFTSKHEVIQAADADKLDTIAAKAVDEKQVQDQLNKIKKLESDKKLKQKKEQDDLADLKRQRERELRRIDDLKKEQKQKKSENKRLEEQRKIIALKKAKEEAERKEAQKVERERRAKVAAQKKKEEDLERQRVQQDFQDQLDAEAALVAERTARERRTTLVQRHLSLIGAKVKSKHSVPPNTESWRKSVVEIKVSPSGVVQSVHTIESSGSQTYDRSVETAVYGASPLPLPDQTSESDSNGMFVPSFEFEVKVKY